MFFVSCVFMLSRLFMIAAFLVTCLERVDLLALFDDIYCILDGEERAGCFTLIVLLISCDC